MSQNPYDSDTLEAGMNRVGELISEQVVQHQSALLAKYRTTRFMDAYGRWVDNGWDREVEYFCEHVVLSRLKTSLKAEDILQLSDRFYWLAVRNHIPCKPNRLAINPGSAFASICCMWITVQVKTLAEGLASAPLGDPNEVTLTPGEYERYCALLLKEAGWAATVLGGKGDQGVDILAERSGRRLVVQCKYYSQPVGNDAVQEVHAGRSVHGAEFACVVSNCDYTSGARIAATRTGVLLLHHNQLREVARELGG